MNESMIDLSDFRERLRGCWMGKAVGGTLGMPYEGVRDRLALTFYDPVPAQMLPNDDLDLQVVYAFLLDRMDKPRVSRHGLTPAWEHVGMTPDEYGVCKRNLALGLRPPTTGTFGNWFTDGMGAAIRTELWAALAAGDPQLAAAYAYEDACMDHAGEGIYAAQFLAAIEALAFVESDIDTLINAGLSVIPSDSRIAQGARLTRESWRKTHDVDAVYRRINEEFDTDNFTDVKINLPYILLGWLASDGDFSQAICTAVNCGEDTDCTGATLGALMGILNPAGIDARWLEPIGNQLVLSDCITGVEHPPTLDGFTEQVITLRQRINYAPPETGHVSDEPQNTDHLAIDAQLGFVDWNELPTSPQTPAMPENTRPVRFDSPIGQLAFDAFEGRIAILRFTLTLERAYPKAILLFNTAAWCRVYLDDRYAFGRDGGWVCPAFHRAPLNQTITQPMTAGRHTVTVLIQRPRHKQDVEWTFGLADADTPPSVKRSSGTSKNPSCTNRDRASGVPCSWPCECGSVIVGLLKKP